jgi:hypothetical protein
MGLIVMGGSRMSQIRPPHLPLPFEYWKSWMKHGEADGGMLWDAKNQK